MSGAVNGRGLARACMAALVVLAAAMGAEDLADFDLGLARATGRFIVEHAALPHTNVFSAVNAERPFVDDKWLFHVFAWWCVDVVGPAFAVAVRMALLVLLAGVLAAAQDARQRVLGAGFAVVALITASSRFEFRPDLFTLLFTAVFARLLLRPEAPGRGKIALLLALQALWTNLHGYFVLGPILAAAAGVGAVVDARVQRLPWRPAARRLLLPLALAAVGLLNPYGWHLLRSPVDILLDLRQNHAFYSATIVEFVPTFAHYPVLPADLIAFRVLCAAVLLGALLARRSIRWVELLPLGAFFVMALDIRRNVAPFAVVAAPLAARWFAAALARMQPRWSAPALSVLGGFVAAGALCATFAQATQRLAVRGRMDETRGFSWSRSAWPDAEVDFVLAHLPPDGLFNSFSFGSYFVGRAFPERRPFIDGNTAGYDVAFLREYADFVSDRLDVDAFVQRYGLRTFLLKPGHPVTARLLQRDDCVPLYLGRHALVLGLRGRVDDAVLERFDLRRALADGRFDPPATPVSTFWTRRLPTAELNRAQFLQALGRPRDAVHACQQAAVVNPELYEPWHLMGALLLQADQAAMAHNALDEAVARAPCAAAPHCDRGLARTRLGRLEEARTDFAEALDRDPSLVRAHLGLALVLQRLGEGEDAVQHAREALALAPAAGEREAAERLLRELGQE